MTRFEILSAPSRRKKIRGTILFVHGVYHGAWCWGKFLEYCSERGYDAHAMSLRGHGRSEGTELVPNARFEDYFEDLRAVIDRLGVQPILVGHSLGGILINRYLEHHSVPAAVMISTPTPAAIRRNAIRLFKRWPIRTLGFGITKNPDLFHHGKGIFEQLYFSTGEPDEKIRQYLPLLVAQKESHRIFDELARMLLSRPSKPVPVLVLGGGRDFTLTRGDFEELAAVHDGKLIVFEGEPHDMILGPRWQDVAECLLGWLAER